jgi:hypothetical protein
LRINLIGAFIRNKPFGTEIAFKKGFDRIGGHEVTVIDPEYPDQKFDYDADATVLFKWIDRPYQNLPDYWEDLKKCSGKKIVYQPDDLRFPHIKRMMQEVRKYCDYAFVFDDDGVKLALEYGYKDAKKLLLTADDDIYKPIHVPKVMDAVFVGSLTGGDNHKSRVKMINLLRQERSFKIGFANDIYDVNQISRIYSSSKVVLNHATDVGQPFGTGYGYQCRHFEAGFTRSAVLSNVVVNDNTLKNFATFSSEEELVEQLRNLIQDDEWREDLADEFFKELKASHRPEHRAREMIDFIRRLS